MFDGVYMTETIKEMRGQQSSRTDAIAGGMAVLILVGEDVNDLLGNDFDQGCKNSMSMMRSESTCNSAKANCEEMVMATNRWRLFFSVRISAKST